MRFLVAVSVAMSIGVTLAGQPAAEECTFKWFTKDRDAYIKRLEAVHAPDIIAWHKAGSGPIPTITADDVFSQLAWYNPVWSTNNQPAAGAMAKYMNRLSQLPAAAVEEFAKVIQVSKFRAGLGLAAEDVLFPDEKYSSTGLAAVVGKCKFLDHVHPAQSSRRR
jgi:hypothetical protein